MSSAASPDTLDYGGSTGASKPGAMPVGYASALEADETESWGDGEASAPTSVKVNIGKSFAGEGHAPTLRRMYDRSTLFTLLGNVVLAALALLMFSVAAAIVIYAPADRQALIPWIALPPVIISCGLGGFAVFRLSFTSAGMAVTGDTK